MKKNSQAFVNQLLVCLLVTIGFGGTIGLGTVWMRHQISVTANDNRKLAAKIDYVERQIEEMTTLLETEKRPELLRQLNQEFRLGLVRIDEVPVTTAETNPAHMAERSSRALGAGATTEHVAQPLRFNLAQN
jgi:hypothetical protein